MSKDINRHLLVKGNQNMPPNIHLFNMTIILSQRQLKYRKCRKSSPFSVSRYDVSFLLETDSYHCRDRPEATANKSWLPALVFPLTPSPFTTLNANPTVSSILHRHIVSLEGIKTSCSVHSFGSSFSCEVSHVHVKKSIQFVCFSPVNLSVSVEFSDPARDLKRAEKNIFLPYMKHCD